MDNVFNFLALVIFELCIISWNGCSGMSGTISCFVCSSRNGSYTACEDPFNAGTSTYIERCKVPRRGHIGEFPAHFCIKIIGTSYTTNEKIVIRRCVSATMDTQCGKFIFEDDLLRGCILTCDLDGCNSATFVQSSQSILFICTITVLLISSLDLSFVFKLTGAVYPRTKLPKNVLSSETVTPKLKPVQPYPTIPNCVNVFAKNVVNAH